jgi:hypothetical protein
MSIEIATDAAFNDVILSQALENGQTTFSHTFSQDYSGLHWRVVATTLTGKVVVSPGTEFGIDTTPPSTLVNGVFVVPSGHFILAWSGSDEGSGIVAYYVDFSPDGVAWQPLFVYESGTSGVFIPPDGHTPYYFRSRGIDALGNIEPQHAGSDINTDQAETLSHAIMLPRILK